jgi:uncharacterized membrane protein (UPF0182 family)
MFAILIGGAVALLIARGLAEVYTDFLWYSSLSATDIWRAKFWSLLTLRFGCTLIATLFVFANLYAVRQSVVSLVLPRRLGNIDIGEEVPREQLTYTAGIASVVMGVLLAWSRSDWSGFLAARVGRPFGESDPYFAEDLAFFVHRLPFELSLFNWALVIVLTVIGIVVLLYALTPSLRWEQGSLYVSGYVRRHLAMLAGTLLLMLSWHYRLEMYSILGAGSGADGAFTYFDHRVGIPASLVMFVVTLAAGLTVLWAGWTGQMRVAFAALTGVIIAVLAARQVAPFIAKRAVAERDPLTRERGYEGTRAGYTRRAFGVDRIATADSTIAFSSLTQAAPFISVWDDGALRRTAERSQPGAGVSWQAGDSAMLGIVAPTDTRNATHAFLAGAVDDAGGAVRVPRDGGQSPVAVVVADSVARPIVVADSTGRLAAPSLGSALTRFAYALAMQDVRVWFAPATPASAHMVERRSVRARVGALAPFFAQGSTITPIWVADTLAWAIDVYSSSRTYPLSRRIVAAGSERAYFQHAATAIVNSASGRVVFVADSAPDAVAATWIAQFPKLFSRPTALRAGVKEQLPPAIDGARAQANAFGRYGMRGESDVVRHLPDDDGPDSALVDLQAPPITLPRTGVTAAVLPLLDRTERIRGLFIAFGGPSHRSAWLPARDPAPLWSESLDRLRAADTTSGTTLVRGYARVLPVGNRIVILQPRFDLRASAAPRLLYVSAAFGDSVRSARSVFQLAGRPAATTPISNADFRARVQELYYEMQRASSRGDYARFGRALDALGALLRQPRR